MRHSVGRLTAVSVGYLVTAVASGFASEALYRLPLVSTTFKADYGFYILTPPVPFVGVVLLFPCRTRGYGIAVLAGWLAFMVWLIWGLVLFAQGD